MFSTPEFWILIAFILFLGGIGKKAFSFLTQSLDQYRQKITHQLNEAQRLHDEALSLLNSYQQKHKEAHQKAEEILSLSKIEAEEFKKSSERELEKRLAQKEKAFLERLAIEAQEIKIKLRKEAVDEAFALVEKFLAKETKEKEKLTKLSLKEIPKILAKRVGKGTSR